MALFCYSKTNNICRARDKADGYMKKADAMMRKNKR